MPFFFIFPAGILAVITGFVLMLFAPSRTLGRYVISASAGATVMSFALSTLVLFALPRLAPASPVSGLLLLGLYVLGIAIGGLLGGALGLWLAWKLNRRVDRKVASSA